jgi:hypothetical protein
VVRQTDRHTEPAECRPNRHIKGDLGKINVTEGENSQMTVINNGIIKLI